jgi:hypothetical protein
MPEPTPTFIHGPEERRIREDLIESRQPNGVGSPLHRLSNTVAKIRRANVGSNEQGFVDAFNSQMLPLTQSG